MNAMWCDTGEMSAHFKGARDVATALIAASSVLRHSSPTKTASDAVTAHVLWLLHRNVGESDQEFVLVLIKNAPPQLMQTYIYKESEMQDRRSTIA
jgi:hypothetical protein